MLQFFPDAWCLLFEKGCCVSLTGACLLMHAENCLNSPANGTSTCARTDMTLGEVSVRRLLTLWAGNVMSDRIFARRYHILRGSWISCDFQTHRWWQEIKRTFSWLTSVNIPDAKLPFLTEFQKQHRFVIRHLSGKWGSDDSVRTCQIRITGGVHHWIDRMWYSCTTVEASAYPLTQWTANRCAHWSYKEEQFIKQWNVMSHGWLGESAAGTQFISFSMEKGCCVHAWHEEAVQDAASLSRIVRLTYSSRGCHESEKTAKNA